MNETLGELAGAVIARCLSADLTVATAESCTGGWIAKRLTDIPGSSAAFGYGIVSYSNAAKQSLLNVTDEALAHGAVSEPVVEAMAAGVRILANATVGVAVSGVAGPDGGSDDKPVGTVWFAWASADGVRTDRQQFDGGRDEIRQRSVAHALKGLLEVLE